MTLDSRNRPADAGRVRTCIATRARRPETELLRVVARRGEDGRDVVVPDPLRRMTGRGAWLTPTPEAWGIADRRRAFGRALKVSATADAGPVLDHIRTAHPTGDDAGRAHADGGGAADKGKT